MHIVATGNTESLPGASYIKLQYIGNFSKLTTAKITKLLTKFCKKGIDIKLNIGIRM